MLYILLDEDDKSILAVISLSDDISLEEINKTIKDVKQTKYWTVSNIIDQLGGKEIEYKARYI